MAYESLKLKDHEQKYFSYDLELIAVVHTLKMWRNYLLGKKFLLMTYHNSLTNFFGQPNLNYKQVISTEFLSEFDFDINHLKGKENRVVNASSRKLHCAYEIRYRQVESNFSEQIKEVAN